MLLAGCTSNSWSTPHASPSAVGGLGAGFSPSLTPAPEATITPAPGSWDAVRPSPGYRVVLVTTNEDDATRALVSAIQQWASSERADLRTLTVQGDPVREIDQAIGMHPDLVLGAGNGLVDALALVTASNLQQKFLVVGAEIAEPTYNVTAVGWTGASFRGEGLNASSAYDPATFTPQRCATAVRAGVASVLTDLTGIVVWLG